MKFQCNEEHDLQTVVNPPPPIKTGVGQAPASPSHVWKLFADAFILFYFIYIYHAVLNNALIASQSRSACHDVSINASLLQTAWTLMKLNCFLLINARAFSLFRGMIIMWVQLICNIIKLSHGASQVIRRWQEMSFAIHVYLWNLVNDCNSANTYTTPKKKCPEV